MHALDCLVAEHELIWVFLETITVAQHEMEQGVNPPRRFFDLTVEFAREFVDRFHHGKEELQAFDLLARKHHGALDRHIEVLNQQHDEGRAHISAIARAMDGYAAGTQEAIAEVLEHVTAFATLLRLHIHREDDVFFPLARESFTPEETVELDLLFRQVDECMGEDFIADSHRMVRYMRSLLVRPVAPAGG
jgi:hemerythrin-like domain-containing protein